MASQQANAIVHRHHHHHRNETVTETMIRKAQLASEHDELGGTKLA